jgi:hypothetical protein
MGVGMEEAWVLRVGIRGYRHSNLPGIWMAQLLAEFSNSEAEQVMLKVDNKSSITLAKNPTCSTSDPSTSSSLTASFRTPWKQRRLSWSSCQPDIS